MVVFNTGHNFEHLVFGIAEGSALCVTLEGIFRLKPCVSAEQEELW